MAGNNEKKPGSNKTSSHAYRMSTRNADNNARKGPQPNMIPIRHSVHESNAPTNDDPCV